MCYNGQYRRNGDGKAKSYMLYGRVHNTFDEYLINDFQNQTRQYQRPVRGSDEMSQIPCQMINCFCMFSDYVPLTLDEWIELDKRRRAKIKIEDYQTIRCDKSGEEDSNNGSSESEAKDIMSDGDLDESDR